MPAAPLLDDAAIDVRLAPLRAWSRAGNHIERTLRFPDFAAAVEFVARLVAPADQQNHHPDVAIHWNEVTLRLWTHAAGGLTERDFRLAETIDRIADAQA